MPTPNSKARLVLPSLLACATIAEAHMLMDILTGALTISLSDSLTISLSTLSTCARSSRARRKSPQINDLRCDSVFGRAEKLGFGFAFAPGSIEGTCPSNPSCSAGVCCYRCRPPRRRGSIDIMFETFDHTADLGLRVRAPDLDTLFSEAGLALFSTLVENLASVRPRERADIALAGKDREYLLFDWLKELLFHFDAKHMLFSRFVVKVREDGLTAEAWGEPLDRARHVLEHEVKAITYHGLTVEQTADGWLAEVIVDI